MMMLDPHGWTRRSGDNYYLQQLEWKRIGHLFEGVGRVLRLVEHGRQVVRVLDQDNYTGDALVQAVRRYQGQVVLLFLSNQNDKKRKQKEKEKKASKMQN